MSAIETAKAAGYAPAKEFDENNTLLDSICERDGIHPMVIGGRRFYPLDAMRKALERKRVVPEGMIGARAWCEANGVNYNTLRGAILAGRYQGRVVRALPAGKACRAYDHVVPAEAARYFKLDKKPAPKKPVTPDAPAPEHAARSAEPAVVNNSFVAAPSAAVNAELLKVLREALANINTSRSASLDLFSKIERDIEKRLLAIEQRNERFLEGLQTRLAEAFDEIDRRISDKTGGVEATARLASRVGEMLASFDRIAGFLKQRGLVPTTALPARATEKPGSGQA